MLLTDPALRRIAAATADVWPDQMWRFDTADPGPLGEMAKLLHDTSLRFTDSYYLLARVLDKAGKDLHRLHQELAKDAHVHPIGTDRFVIDALAAIERHAVLGQQLLSQYAAWRALAPAPSGPDFHLLLKTGDPSWGVAELRHVDSSQWRVFPDAEAAAHFGLSAHAGRLIGDVSAAQGGFQPTAYQQPEYLYLHPELVYQLPVCEDLRGACRSLLRWWAYRNRTRGTGAPRRNSRPMNLPPTPSERDTAMNRFDPIGALVCTLTGRTLDQHAIDTHPAAAELPGTAELVRHARRELMLTIDDLHQLFASQADADAYRSPETVLDPVLESLLVFASQYLESRALLDKLTTAVAHRRRGPRPPLPAQRRYLRIGDVLNVTLPSTQACIALAIAGRTVRVNVTDVDAETSLMIGPGQLRLAHHDAGIYRDPANGRLYTLDRTAA